MSAGLRGLIALHLVLGGIVLIATTGDRPFFDLLGVAIEIVAGVMFGMNARTARCRS